ncbi:MAG: hypothetical protein NT096_14615 [Proteobacteria bacterium]|nr:hypothetical protein [Pseudomonadota bacterium]
MQDLLIIPKGLKPRSSVIKKAKAFLVDFKPLETINGLKLLLFFDQRSKAHYFTCHITGETLVSAADLEASLEVSDDEDIIYKLNRDITEDQAAYRQMEEDASKGRSFEDLVIEYDKSYNATKPLKVYGGQHRIRAISKNVVSMSLVNHGVRVYFDLTKEQKVEIATINNTSIAVPNDLLDRMREQLLGSELRNWCQMGGLLGKGEDFSDRKSPEAPTVRVARTLIVNFYKGTEAKDEDFHQPVVCKSGGIDEDYTRMRVNINWNDDKLLEMGRQFAKLHNTQRERINNRDYDNYAEFARKALSLVVVASWSYASGLFQRKPVALKNHYALPITTSPPEDPLNAKALSLARLKGSDPDTYRGLGTRINPRELGRMLEVFLVQANVATKRKITKDLANAAIQSYEAKRATNEAGKALGRI